MLPLYSQKQILKNYHHKLFPYAYNILGSSEDAKDVIQDVLVKYYSIKKEHVENEIGYLVKSVINQSINLKKRNHKMVSNSVWLPEPIATEIADDAMHRKDIVSYSMLVLLEKLNPTERAVFILKNAFEYSHKEVSVVINSTVENSRKLLSRAAKKLNDPNLNFHNKAPNSFIENYIKVIQNGDVAHLEKMLSEDISLYADGGKEVKVVREFTTGISATTKLLLYVHKAFLTGLQFEFTMVNHQPAILFYRKGEIYNCQVFEINGKEISAIYSIVDPSKLKSL